MIVERPTVTALVVTYNRKALLMECMASIAAQNYPVLTTVVIDNASTDGTQELFTNGSSQLGNSKIDYHRMNKNLGGAGGFKEGLRIAAETGADWIWLMDDDCIPNHDALAELIGAAGVALEQGKEPSFLASSVFGPQGEYMNVPSVDTRPTKNGYPDWYASLADGMVEIESATFVSLLINCKAVEKLGLPVGNFFIWGDDTEYTTRLTHNFGPAYLVGSSRVLHKRVNAKSLDIKNENEPKHIERFHYLYRNNLIVQRYHYGKRAARKAVLSDIRNALKCLSEGEGGSMVRWARSKAIFAGVIEYLMGRYELEDLGELNKRAGI